MNDIKARIKSVGSTMQITKAMELVATSKLRRAKERALSSRPYTKILGESISNLLGACESEGKVWCESDSEKTLFITVAGDRGLAGGYNANVERLTDSLAEGKEAIFLPIGKKALEYYRHRERNILTDAYEYSSEVGVGDAISLGRLVTEGYLKGEYGKVVLVYTRFVSMMTQLPAQITLLPLGNEGGGKSVNPPDIEGEPDEILARIIPEYVGGIIWAAMCESVASEHGARRSAMNAANKNASEMIDELMLKYNRARQAVITQEITEIVSGAEAL